MPTQSHTKHAYSAQQLHQTYLIFISFKGLKILISWHPTFAESPKIIENVFHSISYLLKHDTELIFLLMFLQDTKSIRCWLSKEMQAASRTLRLAVVVLNSLLTGLFPIPCTSCLEHIWLADSLHAWPQLRGRGLHGSVEAPDPYGATVHLWKSVTDFYIFSRICRGT